MKTSAGYDEKKVAYRLPGYHAACDALGRKITWQEHVEYQKTFKELIAEYHHKIPFADGGSHHINNILLVWHACHTKETAEWRKRKAIQRKHLGYGDCEISMKQEKLFEA